MDHIFTWNNWKKKILLGYWFHVSCKLIINILHRRESVNYGGQFLKFLFQILTLSYIFCWGYFWQWWTNWMNRPRSIYQYFNMAPRLSGQTSIFDVVFFVSKSLLEIEGQKKHEKFAILTRKADPWQNIDISNVAYYLNSRFIGWI